MPKVLEFKLPDLGEGLTEAEIVRWLVEVGDVVAVDQPVVEVETAKAMVEVPCPYGGVVTARFGEEGTELPVGSPLLTVAVGSAGASDAGPAAGSASAPVVDAAAAAGSSASDEAESSGNVLVGYGTGAAVARRRRIRPDAARGAVAVAEVAAPAVAEAVGHDGPVPVISPLVRRLARENSLDLRALKGSGPDGLILRADVEGAIRGARAPERAAPPPVAGGCPRGGERVAQRGLRGAGA
ncbi:biotin/lipoyl-containing protein, partial [Streptomyces chryseus]